MKTFQSSIWVAAALTTTQLFGQNVGIGTNTPANQLDVLSAQPHTARFTGPDNMYVSIFENASYRGYLGSYSGAPEDVDFGTGGSNVNGKLHLTIKAQPRLTIAANGNVGIGTQTPAATLEVNGITNLRSALQINGNPGTAGQVLTSNGSEPPIWQASALSSNTRFGIRMQRVGSASSTLTLQTSFYNLNPADVTIGAIGSSSITINKSGLYRLNGYITGAVQGSLSESPEMTCDLNFGGAFSTQYDLLQWMPMSKRTAVNNNFYNAIPYELDIYLPAGTTISVSISYLSDGTITYQEGNIRLFGYLISE